jgi:hypothetical protein
VSVRSTLTEPERRGIFTGLSGSSFEIAGVAVLNPEQSSLRLIHFGQLI